MDVAGNNILEVFHYLAPKENLGPMVATPNSSPDQNTQ